MTAYPLKLGSEVLAGALLQNELRELFQAAQRAVSGQAKHCCHTDGIISLCCLHHSSNAFLRRPISGQKYTGLESIRLALPRTAPVE